MHAENPRVDVSVSAWNAAVEIVGPLEDLKSRKIRECGCVFAAFAIEIGVGTSSLLADAISAACCSGYMNL
jgi:hypothetical protein